MGQESQNRSQQWLEDQIAIVTGGGTGIGLAISLGLSQAGARVVLLGRREGVLQEAARSIGSQATCEVYDVKQTAGSDQLIERISDKVGTPTILINNAGIHLKKPALETSDEEFDAVIQTHVNGAFALSRSAARRMAKLKQGSIVFVSSMAAIFGIPQVVAYSAAKTAQIGLVRALASECSVHGVRVNAIAPGWIETEMSKKAFDQDPARRERVLQRTPLNRLGKPEEIASVVTFLCSEAASFVNGVVLPVDGGASIGF
ncbi:SDR family NAD(P)-dependent oxidoreductase [Bythopirellula polymerisocia]|uniref:Gluconate 5-dehydrogenase n=1 Tax=Bythopirellula polymerisocia TaxID=2528003 RepID=A0A5C6CV90_9BACT|nr:SDR family NAD(P)-dependent oxidoreductase [Bythopirellula polymerisocia]TWU27574.1 Gluconate 5-dehydrogenase [Bythopirellula polymerisocia]